jgi:membrane-associated protein
MFFGLDLSVLLQAVGYPGIFAIIFAESGLIFAFFLPGATLLFTAGLLAAAGVFNPWILIPLVTLAAILGDNVGYWFGNKIGIKLFTKPDSRFFRQEHLRRTQHFYEKHGAKAVFLARFVPIIRTFTPVVAGIASMHYRTFVTYNILGALAWATGVTTLAYVLGSRFPFIADYIELVLIGIVLITVSPIVWETYKAWRPATPAEPV